MVTVLKEEHGGSKGILVFTHKERRIFLDTPPALADRLDRMKERYVFAMHWGFFARNVGPTPRIDVHLACPGVVDFAPGVDERVVPMCSRNFLPDDFRPLPVPKVWDVVTVTRAVKRKRNEDFVRAVRLAFDRGRRLRVLLVCPVAETGADLAFVDLWKRLFDVEERRSFQVLTPILRDDAFPIPRDALVYFYNSARCFALFSAEEGQPKVVTEALLCGTPVLVRADQLGAGRDHLDASNSATFTTIEEAAETMVRMATEPERWSFDPEPLREALVGSRSRPRLQRHLEQVFADLRIPFEGGLAAGDLSRLLPSHVPTLPRGLCRGPGNDLASAEAALRWADGVLGRSTPPADVLAVRAHGVWAWSRRKFHSARRRLRRKGAGAPPAPGGRHS